MTSRTLGSVYAKRFNLLYNLKENNFYTYIGIKYNTVYISYLFPYKTVR